VSPENGRGTLAGQAEQALRTLRDVEHVHVVAEGNEIREVHIVASSARSPKQIVRDVESLFKAQFRLKIDHRVVSVVSPNGRPETHGSAGPERGPVAAPGSSVAERLRFVSVNLFVSGPRTQAQVELRWKALTRLGSASGWATRSAGHQLVARATVQAVQQYLEDEIGLGVVDVQGVRLGRRKAVVVQLELVGHRRHKLLTGICPVEGDAPQAVVLATLSALNRIIGGLRTKDPIEYVLRPTSA
jgi:hypothetical protein